MKEQPNKRIQHLFFLCFGLILSFGPLPAYALTEGDYTYTLTDGKATITDFNASYSGALSITSTLGGCPVVGIAHRAFEFCYGLTSVTLPSSITSIKDEVFYGCRILTNITVTADNPNYSSVEGILFILNSREV